MTTIYYDTLSFDHQTYYLAATQSGLCFVGSPDHPQTEMLAYLPAAQLIADKVRLAPYISALSAYLNGQTTVWSLPLDLQGGTPLQRQVWQTLTTIPYGQTRNYSQLAALCQRPTAIRAIASAVARNPLLIVIPCHRIIRKDGTLGGYRGGLALKTQLLALEKAVTHRA